MGVILLDERDNNPVEAIKAKIEATKPNPNTAKTMADVVTPKQLVAIRAIANTLRQNAELLCQETRKCSLEELSRSAASRFIDDLKAISR